MGRRAMAAVMVLGMLLSGCTLLGMTVGAAAPAHDPISPKDYAGCLARQDPDRDCTDPATYPELRRSRGSTLVKCTLLGIAIDTSLILLFVGSMSGMRT